MSKRVLGSAAIVLALTSGIATPGEIPIAAANSMQINATGGDGTTVDKDGTQGNFTEAVQGSRDSDGDQDAFDAINSAEASPQFHANNKMTK